LTIACPTIACRRRNACRRIPGLPRAPPPGRHILAHFGLGQLGLLAAGLGLDQREHPPAIAVLEGTGIKHLVQRVDELAGHLDLSLARNAARRGELEVLDVDQLVCEPHRMQRQRRVQRPDRDQVLAVVKHPAPDPDPLRSLHGIVHEPVGIGAVVARTQVIRAVVEHRIDLGRGHELLELDQVRALAGGGVDLLLVEQHVLAAAQLVAAGDLLVGHLLALLGADPLLLDLSSVGRVNLMEVHALVLGRGMDLDRDRGEAERDRAVPDRSRHRIRDERRYR
jgi:hypothetical protein